MQRLTKHQKKLQARLECFEQRICMAGDLADFSIEAPSVEFSQFAEYRDVSSYGRQMESIGASYDFSSKLERGDTVEDKGVQIDSDVDVDPWIETVKVFEVSNEAQSKFDLEEPGKTDEDPFAFSPIDKLNDHDPWLPTESGDSDRDPELPDLDPTQGMLVVPGDPSNSQDGRSNASQTDSSHPEKDRDKPSTQPPPTTSVIIAAPGALQGSELPSSNKSHAPLIANVDGVYANINTSKESTPSMSSLPVSSIEVQRFSSFDMGFTTLQETAVEPGWLVDSSPISSNVLEKRSSADPPRYFVSRKQANPQVTRLRDSFSDQTGSHVADDAEVMISQAFSQDRLDEIILDGRYRSNLALSHTFLLVSHIPDSEKSEEGDIDNGNQASDSSMERHGEGESEKPAPRNRSFQQLLGMIFAGALVTFRGSRRFLWKQNLEEKTLHLSRVSA